MHVHSNQSAGLISVAHFALTLGISEATVRSWILYRRIEFVRVGRRVLIRPETLEKLIQAGTIPAERGRDLVA
jgi:excisionase family DNA binding protein